jgi:hypothetical protein
MLLDGSLHQVKTVLSEHYKELTVEQVSLKDGVSE